MKRFTILWWIDCMTKLREMKIYEVSDGIREMLESKGYKLKTDKEGNVTIIKHPKNKI